MRRSGIAGGRQAFQEVGHWDRWGWHGEMEHVNRPTPNTTPEHAMNELLSKARFVFGEKPWTEWRWDFSAPVAATGTRSSNGAQNSLSMLPGGGEMTRT